MGSTTLPATTAESDKALRSPTTSSIAAVADDHVASPSTEAQSDSAHPASDPSTATGINEEPSADASVITAAPTSGTDTLSTAPSPDASAASDPTIDATAAAAAAAAQAIASAFHDTTADDIKALTKALTTPIEQIEAEEHAAAAAAVAAVAASVAAGTGADQGAQSGASQPSHAASTPAFDVNNVYNQVLSLTSQNQKPGGKRSAQDDFEQNQAARALQLIALSLNSTASSSTELAGLGTNGQASDIIKVETTQSEAAASSSLEQVLKAHTAASAKAGPDPADSLIAISHAINFQSQTSPSSKLEADTSAFAQAVLNATQADANKTNQNNVDGSSTSASLNGDHGSVDHSELHKVQLNTLTLSGAGAGAASSANQASSSTSTTQGFTFEVDKATGKTQIKWTSDPKDDVSNVLQDANATIQQALQTLIASSGLDLGVPNGGLLPPPLGQFPAQGSEFGTAQDPAPQVTPAAAISQPRKKRKTGGSSHQNTAASIPEGSPSYPCTFVGCDKVFARLYNLKSHSRTHTNERPFVCNHCELAFSRNHDLKRHVKIHAGDKPFKCTGCGKSFSRLDALGRHRGNAKNRAGCQGGAEAA
ncbi:hypothetical protein BGZ99_004831 [Dissophora globulifera]|uniref:C2H2-type domain-containing protein n=1 Tax=Dissophora globulifera TaxID=979702 RepID=A0A9P6UTC2_9FUNG|nr:hypothetical protein BGZ99_004831 [Dissophora globulifera]